VDCFPDTPRRAKPYQLSVPWKVTTPEPEASGMGEFVNVSVRDAASTVIPSAAKLQVRASVP
jgi:hypothetical protein